MGISVSERNCKWDVFSQLYRTGTATGTATGTGIGYHVNVNSTSAPHLQM